MELSRKDVRKEVLRMLNSLNIPYLCNGVLMGNCDACGGGGGDTTNVLAYDTETNTLTSTVNGVADSVVIELDADDILTTGDITIDAVLYPTGTPVQAVLEAIVAFGADGNGIYSGSGTAADNTAITLGTSTDTFYLSKTAQGDIQDFTGVVHDASNFYGSGLNTAINGDFSFITYFEIGDFFSSLVVDSNGISTSSSDIGTGFNSSVGLNAVGPLFDTTSGLGAQYTTDYSTTIIPNDRSIPDVGTVKQLYTAGAGISITPTGDFMVIANSIATVTADNGLTKTANNIQLGGNLLANTTIGAGASYRLDITGSNPSDSAGAFTVYNSAQGLAARIESQGRGLVVGSENGFTGLSVISNGGAIGISTEAAGAGATGILAIVDGTSTGRGVHGQSGLGTGVYGVSTNGTPIHAHRSSADEDAVLNVLKIERTTTGAADDGIGGSVEFHNTTTTGASHPSTIISSAWQTANTAARTSLLDIYGYTSAVGKLIFRQVGTGETHLPQYGVGTFTGTPAYTLQVTSTGKIIEGTVSGGSGDISNGGNSTGSAITIGTNDANNLVLETNNVPRVTITGGASTGGAVTIANVTANTSTVQDVLTIQTNSTGTAVAGFGVRQLFQLESSTTDNQDAGGFGTIWTTATHASRTSANVFYGVNNGGVLGEFARLSGATAPVLRIASAVGTSGTTTFGDAGITPGVTFTVGGTQQVTIGGAAGTTAIGGGSGRVKIESTGSTTNCILLSPSSANGTGFISVGGITYNNTSSTRTLMDFTYIFAPTTGTAVHNGMSFSGTINQTGGSNGITRAILGAQVFTALADYRFLEFSSSLTASSGTSTTTGFNYAPTFNLTGSQSGVQRFANINPTLTALVSVGQFIGIDMPFNNANAKGINQTGATTTNIFVGKTAFGSTTAPIEAVDITGNLNLTTAGNKIKIATGTNASVGTATLVGGTVTVATTAAVIGSMIMLTRNTPIGTLGYLSAPTISITNGTSFVINSSSGTDTSTVNWMIIN